MNLQDEIFRKAQDCEIAVKVPKNPQAGEIFRMNLQDEIFRMAQDCEITVKVPKNLQAGEIFRMKSSG